MIDICNNTVLLDSFPYIVLIFSGNMKNQIVGPISFRGMKLTVEELEYMLGKVSTLFWEATGDFI